MEPNKQIKRIKTTAIVLVVLGGLMILSNLPAWILISLSENFNSEVQYVHPVYFVLNGILLLSSGLLLKSIKKVGLNLTLISSLSTVVLIIVYSMPYITTMNGELETIGTIGSVFFMLLFLVPAIFMTRYLLKKEIKNLFN
ncbi:hypothetical protein BY457_1473 [Marinilabilia salmonicolor]|jgi:hypothetical protein|uniref:hypothetical protein n=1 Tax=Marinilabilia salmonicolor TaxID=989 RepID=UPI000D08312D|nr:hypothetical protein [Marinilabilia salmonicolor]PRY85419.1 hypothetical protein BY457_1473 [Marinilabilia salmonicolor]